jgi:hypothetical protein
MDVCKYRAKSHKKKEKKKKKKKKNRQNFCSNYLDGDLQVLLPHSSSRCGDDVVVFLREKKKREITSQNRLGNVYRVQRCLSSMCVCENSRTNESASGISRPPSSSSSRHTESSSIFLLAVRGTRLH